MEQNIPANPQAQENKTAIEFFGIETGIFLILAIIIIGLLNYFNIFSLSKMYPSIFGFLPHQPFKESLEIPQPSTLLVKPTPRTSIKVANPALEVGSDVTGYMLEVKNKDELITLLQEWKVYGLPVPEQGVAETKHIATIKVQLVGAEQPLDKIKTPNGSVYLSSNVIPQANDVILVKVQVGKDILEKRTTEAGGFFQSQFLRTMYFQQATFSTPQKNFKTMDQEAIEKLKQLGKTGKKFFEIQKN